jgi:hypothetical protein
MTRALKAVSRQEFTERLVSRLCERLPDRAVARIISPVLTGAVVLDRRKAGMLQDQLKLDQDERVLFRRYYMGGD